MIGREDIAAAINDGVPVMFGFPVVVRRENEKWILNLAAAHRGEADPWLCIQELGPVVRLESAGDVGMSVGGLEVAAEDLGPVKRALTLAPRVGTRHDPENNARRLAAGREAIKVRNSMVRARLLDAVDGWTALREVSKVIDDDPKHGTLLDPPESFRFAVRLLIVRCPSTGRIYALRVPRSMNSAREARLWTLHGVDPEVEA